MGSEMCIRVRLTADRVALTDALAPYSMRFAVTLLRNAADPLRSLQLRSEALGARSATNAERCEPASFFVYSASQLAGGVRCIPRGAEKIEQSPRESK